MLDEENSLHNLERGGVDLNLQGVNKPKTNLLERQSKRETWCQCAAALNPGLPSKSCLKETKALQRAKPNTFQKNTVTLLDLEGKVDSIPKPFYSVKFCYQKFAG